MKDNLPKNTDSYGRDENGRFTDGNKGKPKGATNRTTKEIREFITNFLNDKAYEIPHIWNTLDDKEKANLYLHLCRLVLPKPPDEKPEDNKGINPINIVFSDEPNELTPEQENRFIELLQGEQTDASEFINLFSMVSMEQFREIIKTPSLTDEQLERLIDKL